MSENAETQPDALDGAEGGSPTAGNPEPSIPKHRFDQVLESNRELKSRLGMMETLLAEKRQNAAPQQPVHQDLNPEDFNTDPQTMKLISAVAERIADRKIKAMEPIFARELGRALNTSEEASFLAKHARKGVDVDAYLPKIREMRRQHWEETRTQMSIDHAFKLVHYDEMIARQARAARTTPASVAQTTPAESYAATAGMDDAASYPGAELTRSAPGAGPSRTPVARKSVEEMTAEELEAHLEGQFRSGHLA